MCVCMCEGPRKEHERVRGAVHKERIFQMASLCHWGKSLAVLVQLPRCLRDNQYTESLTQACVSGHTHTEALNAPQLMHLNIRSTVFIWHMSVSNYKPEFFLSSLIDFHLLPFLMPLSISVCDSFTIYGL